MAKVHVCNVVVLDNPSPFFNPFQFEVTFECIEDLKEGNLSLPYLLKDKLLFVYNVSVYAVINNDIFPASGIITRI